MEKVKIKLNLDDVVENLSFANQLLIAICRVITIDSKLIIMDEPTSALTDSEVKLLFRVIRDLKKHGISTLFVSHKINEVLEIADRITIIRDGKKVGTYDAKDMEYNKIIYLMSGREITQSSYNLNIENKKVIIETKELSKKSNYKDINLKLWEGEILGISGLLGSGRTEFALGLFGLNPPDSGSIFMNNKEVKIKSPIKAMKLGIGYVPEDRMKQGLFMEHSIGNNIISTLLDDLLNKWKVIIENKKKNIIKYWIEKLKIKCASSEDMVLTLSGGNQQRVMLSKWLGTKPKVLILDSPTAGIDVGAKNDILKIIRKLAEEGIGIILISDEEEELLNNCNRILKMEKGRLLGELEVNN
ncbi:MAG: sugar ABC transporter ATP-binding protein [Actinobacteria bacterium]|nr:sugar ABC transporter ATP-binding protein [Actinomycetota bacterium]